MECKRFNSNLDVSGLNKNIKLNKYNGKIYVKVLNIKDSFDNNSPRELFDEMQIRKMIASNPQLKSFLNKNNIKLKLNMPELKILMDNHCMDVVNNSSAIAQNLPSALKQKVNLANLKDGALLHDFGKVLIPSWILSKPCALTFDERKIMDLHGEIGYQLLKTAGINNDVLNLVRYHHTNLAPDKNFIPDVNLQILNLADKYSALTEQRVYKEKYTPRKALTILYKEVKDGRVHPFLFNALVKSVINDTVLKIPEYKK